MALKRIGQILTDLGLIDDDQLQEMLEGIKASVRAKVEHPFRTIKQQFGYGKVRYRGLAKNTNRLYVLSAFTNLLRAEKYQAL